MIKERGWVMKRKKVKRNQTYNLPDGYSSDKIEEIEEFQREEIARKKEINFIK
jgi:hypothetical protein